MTDGFRGKDKLQSFTAIGVVKDGALYQVDMGDGFSPFRQPSRTAVVRTRMPGGGGGVVSRGVPLSQSSTHCGPSTALRDAAVTYAVSPVVPEAAPVARSALNCRRYLSSSKFGSVHVWLKCAAVGA